MSKSKVVMGTICGISVLSLATTVFFAVNKNARESVLNMITSMNKKTLD